MFCLFLMYARFFFFGGVSLFIYLLVIKLNKIHKKYITNSITNLTYSSVERQFYNFFGQLMECVKIENQTNQSSTDFY